MAFPSYRHTALTMDLTTPLAPAFVDLTTEPAMELEKPKSRGTKRTVSCLKYADYTERPGNPDYDADSEEEVHVPTQPPKKRLHVSFKLPFRTVLQLHLRRLGMTEPVVLAALNDFTVVPETVIQDWEIRNTQNNATHGLYHREGFDEDLSREVAFYVLESIYDSSFCPDHRFQDQGPVTFDVKQRAVVGLGLSPAFVAIMFNLFEREYLHSAHAKDLAVDFVAMAARWLRMEDEGELRRGWFLKALADPSEFEYLPESENSPGWFAAFDLVQSRYIPCPFIGFDRRQDEDRALGQ